MAGALGRGPEISKTVFKFQTEETCVFWPKAVCRAYNLYAADICVSLAVCLFQFLSAFSLHVHFIRRIVKVVLRVQNTVANPFVYLKKRFSLNFQV